MSYNEKKDNKITIVTKAFEAEKEIKKLSGKWLSDVIEIDGFWHFCDVEEVGDDKS